MATPIPGLHCQNVCRHCGRWFLAPEAGGDECPKCVENPYTVRVSVGFWLVVAPDGRTLAQCPDEGTAKEIAKALWESVKRTRGEA